MVLKCIFQQCIILVILWHHRGHDRMVVGFMTTYAISVYHHIRCEFEFCSDEVYSIQLCQRLVTGQ